MMMTMTMKANLIMIVMSPQGQEEGIADIEDEEEEQNLLEVMTQTRHLIHLIPLTMTLTPPTLIIAVATALMTIQVATLEEDESVGGREIG